MLGGPAAHAATIAAVDVVSHLERDRVERLGATAAFGEPGSVLLGQLLAQPGSAYSATVAAPDFTNDVDWPDVLAGLPRYLSTEAVVAALNWDLGLTRARPGHDIEARMGFRDPFVAASATKADVDADIFWHVIDLTGFRHSTRAAMYAVALQIARDQVRDTVPDRRAALGVDESVIGRVMAAPYLDRVTAYDMAYLSTLVQHRMVHWQAGKRASTGLRGLPVPYRIARVAAAYRDTQGYIGGFPCNGDATPVLRNAGTGKPGDERPLCFVAATDRAVHRWYVDESRRQAAWIPERRHGGMERLAGFAAGILVLLDLAPLVEIVEAVVADDLVAAELLTPGEADVAAERADLLSCRIPE